jgi:hypothetical protein
VTRRSGYDMAQSGRIGGLLRQPSRDLPSKNCWALAEQAGDATPDKMQGLLERACWDAGEAMAAVREFVAAPAG